MSAMKEMFRDVAQTVMEVERDEGLGRERCQRVETSSTPNYWNGYTKKTVKTQLGEVDIRVPRGRMGSFEPKIITAIWRSGADKWKRAGRAGSG